MEGEVSAPWHESPSAETLAGDSDLAHARGHAMLARGDVVGRYVVLDELGRGGMGVVYAAFDPELDRKVAIKLVRVRDDSGGTQVGSARLVREAQAMAKLGHPNVVAVHDVGTLGAHVFVAMEFVDGLTLRAWARAQPRSWREVVTVMTRAGRGLSAAHGAGLVHGDFKPDNVMIDSDGRVRVMDFGLARPIDPASVADDDVDSMPDRGGVVVGTPGYVAPERLACESADARADQFAFGVTLWQLLYGELPFAGDTAIEVSARVVRGELSSPPRAAKVPGWLHAVVVRSLAVAPADRFVSIDDMLAALARDPSRVRARVGVVLGAAALGLVALGWRSFATVRLAAACAAEGESIAQIWNASRRQDVRAAIEASLAGNAESTWEKLEPWLDEYARAWMAMRTDLCLAADVDGTLPAERRRRGYECLDERRFDLDALVGVLAEENAVVVQEAVASAAGLEPLANCENERALAQRIPLPTDEDTLAAVRGLRQVLARSDALRAAGLYAAAVEEARIAVAQAAAVEWRPIAAAASFRLGRALDADGRYTEAEQALRRAYLEAGAVGADEVAEDAAIQLVFTVGVRSARHADGLLWADHAQMLRERRGESNETLRAATLEYHLGLIASEQGDSVRALEHQRRALDLRERLLGADHPLVATSLVTVALVLYRQGAYDESLGIAERALAIGESALGPHHPNIAAALNTLGMVASARGAYRDALAYYGRALDIRERALGADHAATAASLSNLGVVHKSLGSYDLALSYHRRALAIRERALGADHPEIAESLQNTGLVLLALKQHDEALALLTRGLASTQATFGPDHANVAGALVNIGNVYVARGELDEAMACFERALAIWEKVSGPDHPDVAKALSNIGMIAARHDRHEQARETLGRALRIRERAHGPDHPHVAYSLGDLAEVELASGRAADAVPLLERALSLELQSGSDALLIAATRATLARALWDSGENRARAREQAMYARDAFRDGGEPAMARRIAVERWLATHE